CGASACFERKQRTKAGIRRDLIGHVSIAQHGNRLVEVGRRVVDPPEKVQCASERAAHLGLAHTGVEQIHRGLDALDAFTNVASGMAYDAQSEARFSFERWVAASPRGCERLDERVR